MTQLNNSKIKLLLLNYSPCSLWHWKKTEKGISWPPKLAQSMEVVDEEQFSFCEKSTYMFGSFWVGRFVRLLQPYLCCSTEIKQKKKDPNTGKTTLFVDVLWRKSYFSLLFFPLHVYNWRWGFDVWVFADTETTIMSLFSVY